MRRPRGRIAAPVIALAALIAGCGTSTLSPSEVRSQAGAICQTASARLVKIPTPSGPTAAGPFLSHGVTVLSTELSQLRGLHSSGQTDRDLRAAVDALDARLSRMRGAVRELNAGADPMQTIHDLQADLSALSLTADGHWRAIGVSACVTR